MNNPFAFLSQVTVEAVVVPKKAPAKTAKVLQPENADLRVWNTGAVYPSNALIAEFNLEYALKGAEDPGNGIDIIDSDEMPAMKSPTRFLALSFTSRKEGKIDIFAMTRYNEDNTPIASVATQGSPIFGKEVLLPLLKDILKVEPNEEGFIDLNIIREYPIQSPNGIFRFPKVVSRGPNKGEIDYVRRENQTLFAIAPVEIPAEATAVEEEEEAVFEVNPPVIATAVEEVIEEVAEEAVAPVDELASTFALDGEIEDAEIAVEENVVETEAIADEFADVPFQAPAPVAK